MPPAQLNFRPTHDTNALADAEFERQHGMSPATAALRKAAWDREQFENDATADLESDDPPKIATPAGLSAKHAMFWRFSKWCAYESDKLASLEARRDRLQSLIDAPAESEGAISAMIRRTADLLLSGVGVDESDAKQRAELETKRTEQLHTAQAAALALNDVNQEITIGELRVKRLRERESEFLSPVIRELFDPIMARIEAKRNEVAAIERSLPAARAAIVTALEKDAAADVSRLLPACKGI
jgi:hypothetical protein